MNLPYSYVKASDGSGNASVATVQSTRSAGATTILVDTVQGISTNFIGTMGTPHTFTDPVTGEEITIISEATAVDFAGHVDGSNLEIDEIAPGYTDAGSEVGDIVIIKPTTLWADLLAEALTPTGVVAPFAGSSAPTNWLLCNGAAVSRTDYSRLFDLIGTTFGTGDGSNTFNLPDLRSRIPLGAEQGSFSFTFASGSVNVSNEQITVTASEELITGRKIQLTNSGGALPTGLAAATDYYLIVINSTTIQLASSLANALAGTAVNITAQGSGTNTATGTLTDRDLGAKGGEETHALTAAELATHIHPYGWGHSGNAVNGRISGYNAAAGGVVSGTSSVSSLPQTTGDTAHNNMQPFLALNYIIKT